MWNVLVYKNYTTKCLSMMGLPVGNLFANGQENKRFFLCPSFTNFFAFKIISKLQNYLDKK